MKKNNNADAIKLLCYLGIFVLLLFIILPPLFRFLFPVEEELTEEEREEQKMNLYCIKTEDFDEYKLTTTINNQYTEGMINDSMFTYEIEILDEEFDDDIKIEEYEELKKVNNVDFEEEENKYILKINYGKFDYSNEPLLEEHKKSMNEQMRIYSENNFECKLEK